MHEGFFFLLFLHKKKNIKKYGKKLNKDGKRQGNRGNCTRGEQKKITLE